MRTLRVPTFACRSPLADRANVVNAGDPPVRPEPTYASRPHQNPNQIRASPSSSPTPTIAIAERPTVPLALITVADHLPSADL
jgi:hypothetical protein